MSAKSECCQNKEMCLPGPCSIRTRDTPISARAYLVRKRRIPDNSCEIRTRDQKDRESEGDKRDWRGSMKKLQCSLTGRVYVNKQRAPRKSTLILVKKRLQFLVASNFKFRSDREQKRGRKVLKRLGRWMIRIHGGQKRRATIHKTLATAN